MSDVMVTARMSKAKKDAGNKVLERIGSNASQFINSAYDYLVQHGQSPFEAQGGQSPVTPERLAEALSSIDDMCLPADNMFAHMTDGEIRAERLARKGL